MKIAVIVTTYNRPEALAALFEAYRAQRDGTFEIVVADDGSGAETAAVVTACRERGGLAVDHVWQEDRGFRAAAVRNRALARTKADYVIFTDGDCLPLPDFIAAHRRLAERGWFVAGNRILMKERLSRRILAERLPVHTWPAGRWLALFLKGEINRFLPLWKVPVPGWMRKLRARRWHGVMTCNLAVWREDLLAVNGFDEAYEGWGLEDSDLALRLLHSGINRKSARFATPVFHLWHPENDRGGFDENWLRLAALSRSRRTRAKRGVDRYL
jgi:glycosyltransferase involved in cell wall biosynthesis